MAEYGNDGLSNHLETNNAYGTGSSTDWTQLAAGAGLAIAGSAQAKRGQLALAGLGQVNLETMSPTGRAQMDELLRLLGGSAATDKQNFSKSAAQQDAMGLVNNIFEQYRNTALPTIFNAQTGAGAYNSTGAQLIANDAYASTVNKAATTVNQNVLNYSQAYQQQMSPLMQLLGIDRGSSSFGTDTRGQNMGAAMATEDEGRKKKAAAGGTLGSIAGGLIGAYFGGAGGAAMGSSIGGSLGSSVGGSM